ncbi:MAG: efflux RND transporter periplasmic adaptor subunit [Hyphomicrobiaceae bacterium]
MANSNSSTLRIIVLAAAAAAALALIVSRFGPPTQSTAGKPATVATAVTAAAPKGNWAASAPGRVEPKGGEIRLSPLSGGRIVDVLAVVNDKVKSGDLLIRLDASDVEARLAAAEAEVSVRRRERDTETVPVPARERRTAEDAAYLADRQLHTARAEFDRLSRGRKAATPTSDADLIKGRDIVLAAREKADTARLAVRRLQTADNATAQTRLEAALNAARSEVALADAALERMSIRAPRDGTILQSYATVGESVAPSPENILMMLGDLSALRIKAELEERDAGKVAVGQDAVVKSDAFPNIEFAGRVVSTAQALGPGRIGAKGPRKPTDIDVLEITIDLAGQPQLLPGMRVDVFLKPTAK